MGDNHGITRPIITFSLASTPSTPDVEVTIGESLDGIDTGDLAERLFTHAKRVSEIRLDFPDGRHYTWPVVMPAVSFACPSCGAVSHHPEDAKHRYCSACKRFVTERR